MLPLELAIEKFRQLPPEQRNKAIEYVEFLEFQSSQISQQQTSKEIENSEVSFAEAAKEFIGCLNSGLEDLSHNPQYYLEGFGK